ncbi:DUF2939 domain-containing protein [Bradyrhizobium sp. 149]|uniref:DUF2939 domain-containing protein n=1 Tax=Bradyrhizobium sp. 149 TaxID=2782624 RepID=UPI001FF8F180|nr:DUF2939 domain-containing protein [Bradyrhizobium sp. 149]MCK1655297.1 DUF2939 domain-containing protein [Bradyrhizobium sp. 149]
MKWLIGILLVVLVCVGVYAGSAFVSLVGLVSAVRGADVAQVIAPTDMLRVRHSVDQVMTTMTLSAVGTRRAARGVEHVSCR